VTRKLSQAEILAPLPPQMTKEEAHEFASEIVVPALLELAGIEGRLESIEDLKGNRIAEALDMVGGVDFWVHTPDKRLLAVASRVQWWHEDGIERRSFTVRLGRNREAEKRVRALAEGGVIPEFTAQGYMERPRSMVCGGIIRTWELFAGFVAARAHPNFSPRRNRYDGIWFWPGHWKTLRRYGNGTTLQTIGEDVPDIREAVENRYQTSASAQFCPACRSHFCPHVAPHLYQPPFTKQDELEQATAAWENA
jgi:hypothetical protein